jgi:hypothetical protein
MHCRQLVVLAIFSAAAGLSLPETGLLLVPSLYDQRLTACGYEGS